MSIQTNFRAQDMLGAEKPVAKKTAPAPRVAAPTPKVEPVVVEPVVAEVEETVAAPAAEETSTEE
jgi:uncharacterized protein YbjT (DUF2867 family)